MGAANEEMVMPTKDETARNIADIHYQIEDGITQIYRITSGAEAEERPNEPVKLLEVHEGTIPAGIMPLRFGPIPSRGIHYPSVIVEITPDEFAKVQARELKLPKGWTLGDLIPRATVNGVA
jgi:hypothetical protein